jgi:hypothetical protein
VRSISSSLKEATCNNSIPANDAEIERHIGFFSDVMDQSVPVVPASLHREPPTSAHDFNGNMLSDIVRRDTGGDIAVWLMRNDKKSPTLSSPKTGREH